MGRGLSVQRVDAAPGACRHQIRREPPCGVCGVVERRPVEGPRGLSRSADCRRAARYRVSSSRLRRASRILDRRSRIHPHVVLPYRADTAAHVVVRVCRAGSRRCREPERAGGCRAGRTSEDRGCASCKRDTISRACDKDDAASRAYRGALGGREHRSPSRAPSSSRPRSSSAPARES